MKLPKGSSDAQREKLFTFVTEHAGTTTIEQFRGSDPTQALEAWIGESIVRPEKLHPEDRSSSPPQVLTPQIDPRAGSPPRKSCGSAAQAWRAAFLRLFASMVLQPLGVVLS